VSYHATLAIYAAAHADRMNPLATRCGTRLIRQTRPLLMERKVAASGSHANDTTRRGAPSTARSLGLSRWRCATSPRRPRGDRGDAPRARPVSPRRRTRHPHRRVPVPVGRRHMGGDPRRPARRDRDGAAHAGRRRRGNDDRDDAAGPAGRGVDAYRGHATAPEPAIHKDPSWPAYAARRAPAAWCALPDRVDASARAARKPLTVADIPAGQGPASLFIQATIPAQGRPGRLVKPQDGRVVTYRTWTRAAQPRRGTPCGSTWPRPCPTSPPRTPRERAGARHPRPRSAGGGPHRHPPHAGPYGDRYTSSCGSPTGRCGWRAASPPP
jgi:hypothetical protein